MTSAWWLLIAFVGGGCAGILVMALMHMAGDLPEQSGDCPSERLGDDWIRIPGRKETFCTFRCRDSFVDANHLFQADSEDRQFGCQYFERRSQHV